ncbi:MAG: hypothetical protein H6983_22330 [Ectothiorhodospiraceae bacterium]|nr:hypothetical protein [Chromatiales bacterium]MCP5156931.1 hypothetical protein [Ectothiorhodospiraceae bacterium]
MDALLELLRDHEAALWLVGIGSLVTLVLSALLIPWLIVRLPADFYAESRLADPAPRPRTVWRLLLGALRNAVGAALLAAGVLMLFLPGQGLLTILIGLACLDFPGKRRLERMIVTRPSVVNAMNWIRARAGRPPLRL